MASAKIFSVPQELIAVNTSRNLSCVSSLNSSNNEEKKLPKIYTKTGDKGRLQQINLPHTLWHQRITGLMPETVE